MRKEKPKNLYAIFSVPFPRITLKKPEHGITSLFAATTIQNAHALSLIYVTALADVIVLWLISYRRICFHLFCYIPL